MLIHVIALDLHLRIMEEQSMQTNENDMRDDKKLYGEIIFNDALCICSL